MAQYNFYSSIIDEELQLSNGLARQMLTIERSIILDILVQYDY